MAITLDDALDLLPEAWAGDIADDAASQGCDVSYAIAHDGLRTVTIERVRRHFAAREDDADWQALSQGQQLDEVFPAYNGIGSFELLSELGMSPAYGPFGLLGRQPSSPRRCPASTDSPTPSAAVGDP